jgi:hypothetical protein
MLWSTILVDFFATFLALAMVLLPIFANDILHGGVITIIFVGLMALLVPTLRKYQAAD